MDDVNVRVRLDITGVVQGVGFRPAVARIAAGHGLSGWVCNDAGSVHCELEGPAVDVDACFGGVPAAERCDELPDGRRRCSPTGERTLPR